MLTIGNRQGLSNIIPIILAKDGFIQGGWSRRLSYRRRRPASARGVQIGAQSTMTRNGPEGAEPTAWPINGARRIASWAYNGRVSLVVRVLLLGLPWEDIDTD